MTIIFSLLCVLQGLFATDVSTLYDAVIRIRGRHMVRKKVVNGKVVEGPLPVIDYDPVREYIKSLRDNFSSIALFFHNKYAGDLIGVVWKRTALSPRDPKVC